ncbi:filamentous hemagglutinin N-terminal domain-containing protein [Variovorax dokdonensis]|uniref:Filamentous hemagglutinin N-terminal domain-containing protein n=1 Tax=Variovorax dokdonensis TaxID=344883 RepID=A0ABT7NFA3_9BURK|nr:filamentous hemagglutinin N-terminal domain-containing protein [Variovorax dokdonensis]MDM0046631.1 filamentous hemagglutinin N-terminal domain-containing protein [Variovorax dokdonensis]
MNKYFHRVIFNAARGLRMVVQETARSVGKGASRSTATTAAGLFGTLVLVGSVHAQIVADPNAPGNQRPTVLPAPNGAPVVNIQAPSAAGVSRNTYKQFDVDGRGAILNNSRTNVQSQTGGWIQGNPWLARGPVRIILNEVNSANPSQLRGFVEVAGQKAEVIIANPAGIQVDGGGFINAGGVTLTTGTPQFNNAGSLESFLVRGGTISIEGAGLDASRTDYAAILSRALQVNAGIWAKELKVVTGANSVSADAAQATPVAGAGAAPTFALDVSQLGGMYANKIVLIGTEAGVGVRNAGGIGAGAGELVVTSAGRLENRGTMEAARLQLASASEIDNSGGTLRQTGGNALTISAPMLSNRNGGVIGAEPVAVPNAGEGTGTTEGAGAGGGGSTGTGGNGASNSSGGTGSDPGAGPSADAGAPSTAATVPAPLPPGQITATDGVRNDGGRIYVGGDITLQTPQIDNSGGTLSVKELNVSGPRFANAGGTLNVRERFSANVGEFDNSGGALQAGQVEVDASGRFINRGGTLRSSGSISVVAREDIDNGTGRIESGGDALLRAGKGFNNQAGRAEAMGALEVQVGHAIDNASGTLAANQGVSLSSQSLSNAGGRIESAQADVRLSTLGEFDNADGSVSAANDLVVDAGALDVARGGALRANRDVSIHLSSELNAEGRLQAGRHLGVQAGSIRADQGSQLLAGVDAQGNVTDVGDLRLQTSGDLALHGTAVAAGDLSLDGSALDLSASTTSARSTKLSARQGGIDTSGATISSGGLLEIRTRGGAASVLNNQNGLLSAGAIDVVAGAIDNSSGGRIEQTGEGVAAIATEGNLSNNGGSIVSAGGLQLEAGGSVDNTQGSVVSRLGTRVAGTELLNTNGSIVSVEGDAAVDVQGAIVNSAGAIQSGKAVTLSGQGVSNESGLIAAGSVDIDARSNALDNTNGKIIGQDDAGTGAVHLAGASLTNAGGLVGAQQNVDVRVDALTNQDGQIVSGDALQLQATTLDNTEGLIRAGGAVQIEAQRVRNSNTVTRTAGALLLAADGERTDAGKGIEGNQVQIATGTLLNDNGAVRAIDKVSILASALVDNAGGDIEAGNSVELRNAGTDANRALAVGNGGGSIVANGHVAIDAASLSGNGSVMAGEQLDIALTQDFDNSGHLVSAGDLSLSTKGRLTNSGDITAWGTLHVAAKDIDNTATGEISGANTIISATGNLTNRGLIDGNATRIDAGELTNIGTGRIYGGQLSIAAKTLNNLAETVDGQQKAATIAARERLDVGALTLNNNDGALIYSDGDMAIGGALDANGRATGSALSLNNHAASIESAGNMRIDTLTLSNTNGGVSWSMTPGGGERVIEYAVPGDARRYPADQVLFSTSSFGYGGWMSFTSHDAADPRSPGDNANIVLLVPAKEYPLERFRRYYLQSPRNSADLSYQVVVNPGSAQQVETQTAPGAWYPRDDAIWADFGVAPPPVDVPASHPGWIDPNIVVGQTGWKRIVNTESGSYEDLVPFDHPVTQEEYDQWQAYRQAHAKLDVALKRFIDTITGNDWELPGARSHFFGTYDAFDYTVSSTTPVLTSSAPARIVAGGTLDINLASGRNEMSDILAGGKLTVRGANIANDPVIVNGTRETNGTAIHSYVATHTFSDDERRYDTVGMQESRPFSVTLGAGRVEGDQNIKAGRPIDDKSEAANPSQAQGAGGVQGGRPVAPIMEVPTSVTSGELGASSSAKSVAVRTSMPDATLPTASLFRSVPDSTHLIETDPRFANYRQWLSSDYLLGLMGADPSTTLKRLGDGYYEQRLINEQVAKLTGYRYLDGFSNDEEQYKALMTNGATFAQKFHLTPGVALTAEQMAQLTSDIVWLVEQTVTLPDGGTQKVLVPQLYVRVKPGDIDGSGALLSGREVQMNLSGDLTNRGTVAGRDVVKIDAQNIQNIDGGLITGRQVLLDAKNDINNIGANISAQEKLSLHAGNDINVASSVRQSQGTSGTEQTGSQLRSQYVDRVAGLYVTDPGGSLEAKAEHDINLTGAQVRSEGSVAMEAGHDLNIAAAQTGRRDSFAWSGFKMEASREDMQTQLVGSSVTGAGNVTLKAGNDLKAEAAQLAAGEDATLHLEAGKQITLRSGLDQQSSQTTHDYKSGVNYQNLSAAGTQTSLAATTLEAGTIELKSGADTTLAAVKLKAESVDIEAEGRLKLETVTTTDTHQSQESSGNAWVVGTDAQERTDETLNYTTMEVGKLSIQAKGGVVADVGATVSLNQLAQQPGMQWVGQIMNDPALADTAHWNRVEEAHRQWRDQQSQMGPASAALVAVIVGFAAAPAAAAAGTAVAGAAAGGTATMAGTVVAGAVQAGTLALISQASISLINNQGDLGKVMEELGSKQSVRNLAAAIVTGGVLAGMGMPPTGLSEVDAGSKGFFTVLQQNLQAQAATALIQSAINGTDLQDGLQSALISALINTVGAKVASGIGDLKGKVLNDVTHKMAHAIAGCALGAAKAGDKGGCAPGAIGAVVGELMAEAIGQSPELQNFLGGKNEQVYMAGLFASLAGALAGGTPEEIAIANWAGANAAANNAIPHSPSAKANVEGAQENARLTAECEPNCTAEDFRRIDQQVAKVVFAATMLEQADKGGLSQEGADQLAQTILELAPLYGTGESVLQLITGRSSLTGEEASRFWAAVGLVPVGGGVLRKVGEPAVDALTVALRDLRGAAANAVEVGAKGGAAVTEGLAFRTDLPSHMIGPDGFTKSGQLSGTHNLTNATSSLDAVGATYTLKPTGTAGVYELPYTYTNPATGKVVSGSKTVYDSAVFSDQTMLNNAQQAGQQAWAQYLKNPTVKVIDSSVGGVNFRSYINVDKNGNAFIGNVHPIK